MNTEIETKLRVDAHEPVEAALGTLGGEFLGKQVHRDVYFDDAQRTLTTSDRCLRVRTVLAGGQSEHYLTYKGPRQPHAIKKRMEIEIRIDEAGRLGDLLGAIGYRQILSFEKKRRIWRFNQCCVCLDEVPQVGRFVEIEGPDENRIAETQSLIGLGGHTHIGQTYASMVAQVQACAAEPEGDNET